DTSRSTGVTDRARSGSTGGGERVDLLQTLDALELNLAWGLERELPGLGHQSMDEVGDDDLAARGGRGHPGRVVHGMTEEVVGLSNGFADVDTDPDAEHRPGPRGRGA